MLFSKSCRLVVLLFASLLSANAETVRGVQQERELTAAGDVDLGTAANYAILTKTGISTVPGSAITGNIAVSPIVASAMTGFSLILDSGGTFSTSTQVTGQAFADDYATPTPADLTTAISDMETSYTDVAGRDNDDDDKKDLGAGEIGGLTLEPGVYTFGSNVNISDDVTLSGTTADDGPTEIFIIQMTGDLMLAANKKVTLANGVLPENIFWQVAGNVSVMAGAHMEGILLVKTGVTFITGSSLNGRVLAQTACVLQQATIVAPSSN